MDVFDLADELSAEAADVTVLLISSNKTRAKTGKERREELDELKLDLVIFLHTPGLRLKNISSSFGLLH